MWLEGAESNELRRCTLVMQRVHAVREMRLKSPTLSVQRDAETPTLFTQRRQPTTDYLLIPRVSSENRQYIPIGYLSPETIVSDAVQYIPNATLYLFGVLTSKVHNAWMRAVCGRLEVSYRYSQAVYNNFPWPLVGARSEESGERIEKHRSLIEKTAQAILDARALYPDSSLADLYDEATMPIELRKAHRENDKSVMAAYGFSAKMSESEIVARLMQMYNELAMDN